MLKPSLTCAAAVLLVSCLGARGSQRERGAPSEPPLLADPGQYLPDFSYAGYHWGERELRADPHAQVLSVLAHGARPDDDLDDTQAFKSALAQAMALEGPVVVLVPKGRYVLSDYLFVERSRLVMRGEGSGTQGSVLAFSRPLSELPLPAELEAVQRYLVREGKRTARGEPFSPFSWTGGYLWTRVPEGVSSHAITGVREGKRGGHTFVVAQPGALSPGQSVELRWFNREGEQGSLLRHVYELSDVEFGERLWQEPDTPLVTQPLTVLEVRGALVRVKEPLLHDLDARWTPTLATLGTLSEVGFEHLRITFPEVPYGGHHLEAGYNAFHLHDLRHGYLLDVCIENADAAVLTDRSSQLSLSSVEVLGRPGHYGIHLGDVYGAVVSGFRVSALSEHPITFNTRSRGSVFTHGELADARFDQHRGINHQNLFDDIHGQVLRSPPAPFDHGGAGYWGPTHGAFNTFWNIRLTLDRALGAGAPVPLGGVEDAGPARIVGLSANLPVSLRYRGAYREAPGTQVARVPSLYEEQRRRRMQTQ